MSGSGHGNRAIFAAFFANLGIATAKFVGFILTRSSSMLAESVHSLADTGNQGLLLLGGRRAARQADPQHQFGYGRERYFWAFVVALVLAVIALVLAVEMKSLLIGESAIPEDETAIRAALADATEVTGIIHLRTQHLGPEELLVATKMTFQNELSLSEVAGAIDAAEARVRAEVPAARFIFIEPDLRRSS